MFLLPDGETLWDMDTLEASRRAAKFAMEILDEEEPETFRIGNKIIPFFSKAARIVDEEEPETVRTAKENIPVFSTNTILYPRLRRGRFIKRFYY